MGAIDRDGPTATEQTEIALAIQRSFETLKYERERRARPNAPEVVIYDGCGLPPSMRGDYFIIREYSSKVDATEDLDVYVVQKYVGHRLAHLEGRAPISSTIFVMWNLRLPPQRPVFLMLFRTGRSFEWVAVEVDDPDKFGRGIGGDYWHTTTESPNHHPCRWTK